MPARLSLSSHDIPALLTAALNAIFLLDDDTTILTDDDPEVELLEG